MPQSQTMKVCQAAKAGKATQAAALKEEKAFENKVGHDLKKGEERVEERAKSANGRGPVAENQNQRK